MLPRLMYVTNRRLMGEGPELVDNFRRVVWELPSGSLLVHVREKDLSGLALVELCRAWLPIARDAGHRVVINDRLDVARFVEADGVHLPETGLSIEEARRLWPGALVGRSCHSAEGVGLSQGADYVTLAPIHATPSKPDAAGLGLEALKKAAALRVPIYALGGFDGSNAEAAFAFGAHGVAMMRAAWVAS